MIIYFETKLIITENTLSRRIVKIQIRNKSIGSIRSLIQRRYQLNPFEVFFQKQHQEEGRSGDPLKREKFYVKLFSNDQQNTYHK